MIMAKGTSNRFNHYLAIILAVALLCLVGLAVSPELPFSFAPFNASAETQQATRSLSAHQGGDPKDAYTSATQASTISRGTLIFGDGGYLTSLTAITNVGTQNDIRTLTQSVERDPVFSRDGNKVLFASHRDGERNSGFQEIYSMDPNGYNQTRLTTGGCSDPQYGFSYDSTRIVYVCAGDLFTMNADGSGAVQLANFDGDIRRPEYSPDGSKIIFIYEGTIWQIEIDGSNASMVGDGYYTDRARYSPDGSKIIFSSSSEIYSINSDGSNLVKLIDDDDVHYSLEDPTFSPDGTMLLMQCRGANINFCTSNADGSGFTPLGGAVFERSYAAWSPDSARVAFIARHSNTNSYRVYVTAIGGTPQIVFQQSPNSPLNYLVWQPECIDGPGPTPTPTPTPIPGLISEWNFNDFTPRDSEGLNNGQYRDDAYLINPGKRGIGFFSLPESSLGGYVYVPDSPSLDVNDGDYTLSTWFNPMAPAEHYVAGKGACNSASNFYIGVDENFHPFIDISHLSGGSRIGSGAALSQNEWHNLVLRKEGTSFRLYVNGVLSINFIESQSIGTNDAPFTIGKGDSCTAPTLTAKGAIDEILLFGRALNNDELAAIAAGYYPPRGNPTPTPTSTPGGGLVGYWPADGNAQDLAGGNDGELEGDTSYGEGRIDYAFSFDGEGDRVRVRDNGSDALDVQTGDFSLAAWVNIRTNGVHFIAGKEFGDGSYSLKVEGQKVYFYLLNDGQFYYVNTGDDLTLNEWHHIAGVRSDGRIKVFVDGLERSSTDFDQAMPPNEIDFTIGGPDYGTTPQPDSNGLIDEIRVYSRGLTESEIADIFFDSRANSRRVITRRAGAVRPRGQSLTCQPPADPSVQLRVNYPDPVAAGRQGEINVRLRDFAPNGGTYVNLSYADPSVVTGPSSVLVPGGHRELNFNINTTVSNSFRSSNITASLGANGFNDETATVTVTVRPAAPDVAVSGLSAPPSVNILQNFTATWTVTNNGQAPTGSYRQDTFFISPDDQLFNGNDTVVGWSYDNDGVLAPGQSKNMILNSVNIPSAAIPTDGTYYLFVLIGDAGTVQESNGNFWDNIMSVPVQVNRNLPDIVAENINGPSEIEPGVTYTISWDVANRGSAATTTGFRDDIYFSYDQIVGNSDDVLITQRFNLPFTIGQSASYSQQFSLPTVPARSSSDGLFYVKVDAANQVFEDVSGGPAETNNTGTRSVRYEYRVPDLQVQVVTPPAEVDSDVSFDLAWTTRNAGNKAAGPMNERVYFSPDSIVNGNDTEIGSFALAQTLDPGASVNRIQSVTIPTNLITATGDYYVYVKTDADSQINEGTNENNNITFGSVRVRRAQRPDLRVTNVTAPATAFFGQEVQVQWTVSNSGNGPTTVPHWRDIVYLSLTSGISGATQLAALSNVSYLAQGESYIGTATVRIPRGFTGSYHWVVKTDADNTVSEENENNNITSSPITVSVPPLPDLTVSNVQAPEDGYGGQPISISWTVTNSGSGATPNGEGAWTDAIFLSRDNSFSSDDRYIGSRRHVGPLAPNGAYTVSNYSIDLPGDVFGDYFVFVMADWSGEVFEFNAENNNTDFDRIQPGSPMHILGTPPDLAVQGPVSAPANALAGSTVNVQFTVKNVGAFDASASWRDVVYLSTDAVFDRNIDLPIASVVRGNLGAGQQYTNNLTVAIPQCLNGSYYLFGVTDAYEQVFEYDPNGNAESNNVSPPKAITLTSFAPDLQVTNVTVPPIVINGSMPMSWTVKNNGTADATQTGWFDRVFLYNGTQFINLGLFERIGSLGVGAEYTQNRVVQIPLFLAGDFTIFVQADAYNNVPECSFEENNAGGAPTQVGQELPDLRISSVNSPSTAILGSTFGVTWTGRNFGAGMTPPVAWADTVYLSSDATFGPGDQPIGGAVINTPLAGGQSYGLGANVTIPNVTPGNYFLIVNADNGNNVSEGINENNNASSAIPITLTAPNVDLQVTNVSAASVLYSGQYADISWTVTNLGSSPTLSDVWTDHVFISRDQVLDPSDRQLEFRNHNGVLGGGASYTENRSVLLPPGLTGDFYLIVVTDRNNVVVESNETNNASTPRAVNLQLPPPSELNVTNVSPPATISLGEPAAISWTVQNSSANPANGAWQDSVYLSTDQNWDSGDILVGQYQKSGQLGPFATYTASLEGPLPPVEPGTYYVIVRTDSRNTIRESNENNNVASSVASTLVSVPNLTLGVPINTTLVTGQERFYSIFNTPNDETMLITLGGQSGSQNELYSRSDTMVSRSNFQFQGNRPGFPDQENVIRNTTSDKYFTMARGDYVPSSFASELKKNDASKQVATLAEQAVILKAEILPFSIRNISPAVAGNKGLATVVVEGAKFKPGATLRLVGPGNVTLTPIDSDNSTSRFAAIFDLKDKPVGHYDVVVRNPDTQTATLSNGFRVVTGGGYALRSGVIGETEIRPGRKRYIFSASNDGLNDALNVPILISFPKSYGFELDRRNFRDFPISELPAGTPQDQLPLYIDVGDVRTIMLNAPLLRSKSTIEVGVDIDVPVGFGGFKVAVQVMPPLSEWVAGTGQSGARGRPMPYGPVGLLEEDNTQRDCWTEVARQAIFFILGELLPGDCLAAGWNVLLSTADAATSLMLKGGGATGFDVVNALAGKIMNTLGKLATECAGQAIPWFKAASTAVAIFQLVMQIYDCLTNLKSELTVRGQRSIDPNEKLGPAGYGPERWVPMGRPMLYRINFENLSTAEAPAQRIRIVDQLPPTLDPRTVRLVEMGFKQYRIEVPPNRAFYQSRLQLGPDLNELKADISAGLNVTNGTVTWTFTAIDPQTNERPLSPLQGLLPPNNADRDGEGYVIFTVEPMPGQPTRSSISNTATIFFDENEPIVTNAVTNLLDAEKPVSQCSALPQYAESPQFPVSWGGSDDPDGSGLGSYDVYVSENGGPYRAFLSGTTATSSQFNGKWGRSYRFYSAASDLAGNVESAPEEADAAITVRGGAFEGDVATRPNGDNDGTVNGGDVDQVRRFAARLDTAFFYNEFQRADAYPTVSGGDGVISVADIIQTRRYAAGLDPVRENSGPNEQAGLRDRSSAIASGTAGREIFPQFVSRIGNKLTMSVSMDSLGGETGIGFTLNYDASVLANPGNVHAGSGAVGAAVAANTATPGKVGVIVDTEINSPLGAGRQQLVTIEFDIVNITAASTEFTFSGDLVINDVVNGSAASQPVNYLDIAIPLLAPTAAMVHVGGRVVDTMGQPVSNATIILADGTGERRRALTNSFGYYRFDDVEAGRSYVLTASHKRYSFQRPTLVVTPDDSLDEANFIAIR